MSKISDVDYKNLWAMRYANARVSKAVSKLQDLSFAYNREDMGAIEFFDLAIAELNFLRQELEPVEKREPIVTG